MIHCQTREKVYYNAGNGYTVAIYHTQEELPKEVEQKKRRATGTFEAFGYELPTSEGLELDLDGAFKVTKYGLQYEVTYYQISMPTTEEGIEAYLSSSLIKGIGPVTAERIVRKYGKGTFEVLEHMPEKLLDIPGITETRLEEILDGYHASQTLRELMVYLAPFGVTPAKLSKIQEHFGMAAVKVIKENPFRLCEVKGFGFKTVDPIAAKAKDYQPDNPLRIKAAIRYVLEQAEGEGHLFLTKGEIVEAAGELLNKEGEEIFVSERAIKDAGNEMIRKDKELIGCGGGIYPIKNFQAEVGAAADLIRLLMQPLKKQDVRPLLNRVLKEEGIRLSKGQEKAICRAFLHPVTVITGGPGRGKTTIIRIIIRVQELLDKESMILLCAPTGRARRRMYESTGYPALTIHKAIGLVGQDGEEEWNKPEQLPDDLVIADEFSMVDMFLAEKLFGCIKSGARLVMVGDKDQIESVGPGNVFKEIIESGTIPVTVLDTCFRQEEDSIIIENADRINNDNARLAYDESFQFYPAKNAADAVQVIKRLYEKEWRACGKDVDAVQVLGMLREDTQASVANLNRILREIANPKRRGYPEVKNGKNVFRQGDKVMQVKNDDEISNGDMGMALNIYKQDGKDRMRVGFGDDRVVEFESGDFWPLTHAYAISAHKSQGSEYPVVIIPMLYCFGRLLRRNIFYTAVTRGARKVLLVGSKGAIAKAIHNHTSDSRHTNLGRYLRNLKKSLLQEQKKSA